MIYYLHSPKKSTTVDVGKSTRWSRWAKKKKGSSPRIGSTHLNLMIFDNVADLKPLVSVCVCVFFWQPRD